jgi:predicted peptidase
MKRWIVFDRFCWLIGTMGLIVAAGCSTRLSQAAALATEPVYIAATPPPLATPIVKPPMITPQPTAVDQATATAAPTVVPGPTPLFLVGQHSYSTTLQIADPNGFSDMVDVNYLLYLPGDYGRDLQYRWPLIIFLHGASERGDDPQVITRYSIPAFLTNTLAFPLIALSPQSPLDNWWSNETDVLDALLNYIQATYAIDPKRIYLTGQSMGGFGTWAMGLKYPRRFAAIVPVASGWDFTDEFVPANICDLKEVPVWVFHGAQDVSVLPDQALAMVQALQDCQGNVRLTLYSDADHLDSSHRAYADPELYDWLLKQSLK